MDHAKALADALMETLVLLRKNAFDQDHRTTDKAQDIVLKALRAYDAHPAEAVTDTRPDCSSFPIVVKTAETATRENGDIAAIREHHRVMVEKVEYGYDFGCRLGEFAHRHRGVLLAALSQQGKCFECGSDLQAPICPKCNPEFDISRAHQQQGDGPSHIEAYDEKDCFGFSRAPQPDTVTEELRRYDLAHVADVFRAAKHPVYAEWVTRIAAALAARGKA